MNQALLRKIPKVDQLLQIPALAELTLPRQTVIEAVRKILDELRTQIREDALEEIPDLDTLCKKAIYEAQVLAVPSLRGVINGTGIVLHTNLGRACLSKAAAQAAQDVANSYSTLEYNLATGKRGLRYSHVESLLCKITGAESALVVNNNAAAVLLMLSALTAGGEVVCSRGELVEIGGSFRVPDIMEACGAKLREVGTTNKTHIWDYERAIGPETKALMKVHTSNFRIVGFSETPEREDLVKLGKEAGLPVLEDIGSGCFVNLEQFGLLGEPTVQDSLAAGVDLVTFSGDKLLGGPQAGIIVGRKDLVQKLKSHPLTRAMRVDKMTLAALEATLKSYANGTAEQDLPTLSMLRATSAQLFNRAKVLSSMIPDSQVLPSDSQVGGGSVPGQILPSYAVTIAKDPQALEAKLRGRLHPILGYIHQGRYCLDVRTLRDEDFSYIAEAVQEAMK